MKIADLYIRVSTEEQADKGYSQRSQQNVLLKYCEINAITVRNIITEDYSAKTFERPQWKKLLLDLKKTKGKANLILFTKWDRFSRNTSDAYLMIKTLNQLGIEPQAIEQPLDISIPENKMMLALYLTTPEIENDRRSLNVKDGLRQARKEGRWTGTALPGYINKTREDGTKYIAISEPQASHMKWAFEQISQGIYSVAEIWKMAKQRGLTNGVTSFRDALKNIGYCGKIKVPSNKYETAYLVNGQHQPLISKALFYKVQDVLSARKRKSKVSVIKKVSKEHLPLRGFLICATCARMLTGSASKGSKNYFHYYHCQSACKCRYPANKVNSAFIKKLQEFIPKPETVNIYRELVANATKDHNEFQKSESKTILNQISENNNKVTKARELLLVDSISPHDYKLVKSESEDKILRLEAELAELMLSKSNPTDLIELLNTALERIKNIDILYLEADIELKRLIISSIFPEKWIFDGTEHRTNQTNLIITHLLQINKELEQKKTEVATDSCYYFGPVPSAGVEPARFPTGV